MIDTPRVGLNTPALRPYFSPAVPDHFTRRRESRRRIEPDASYKACPKAHGPSWHRDPSARAEPRSAPLLFIGRVFPWLRTAGRERGGLAFRERRLCGPDAAGLGVYVALRAAAKLGSNGLFSAARLSGVQPSLH